MNRVAIGIVIALALVVVSIFVGPMLFQDGGGELTVSNFEECVAAGNPVMESFPRQCRAGDMTFVEALSGPTSADNAPPGSIHNLPVPEAVAAARSYAAAMFGVGEGEAIVLTAYEREWSDSCLGLGQPNESCALVITPGYEVTG